AEGLQGGPEGVPAALEVAAQELQQRPELAAQDVDVAEEVSSESIAELLDRRDDGRAARVPKLPQLLEDGLCHRADGVRGVGDDRLDQRPGRLNLDGDRPEGIARRGREGGEDVAGDLDRALDAFGQVAEP